MSEKEGVDVSALVQSIREDIKRRRAEGDLTREDIEWLLERRLKASIARAEIDERIAARLLQPSHDWNIDTDYEIRTDRKGPSGLVIRAVKFVVRPFVRLYTDHILKRQSQLNLVLWHTLLDSVEHGVALELEVRRLRKDVADLKERG